MIDAIAAPIAKIRQKIMRLNGAVVLRNIGGRTLPLRALVHYKMEPLLNSSLSKAYRHTNNWEVTELVRLLNEFGFAVDFVDRSNRTWRPKDEYDLLIGDAAGNSGKHYPIYAERLTRAVKIFYALAAETGERNRRVLERYAFLRERRGIDIAPMRIVDRSDMDQRMALSDAIVCFDDNGYSSSSYARYNLPIFPVHPSASPAATFDPRWMATRRRQSFLAFTGDGFFVKGIDLLVEAFLERPDAELFIAGPPSDKAFFNIYGDAIKQAPNIRYEGFLQVGGARYRELMARCSWLILPPASEGCATSITTCMRSGLVPVTSYESGVAVESCGYTLSSVVHELPADIRRAIDTLSVIDAATYAGKVNATLIKARDYSQATFSTSWSKALAEILYTDVVARRASAR